MDYSCQYPIQIVIGSTFVLPVTYEDENGNVVDLRNYDVRMQVRKTPDDEEILLDLSVENGGIILDGINGRFDVNISSLLTYDLAPCVASYDLFVISNSGVSERLLQGQVNIVKPITDIGGAL